MLEITLEEITKQFGAEVANRVANGNAELTGDGGHRDLDQWKTYIRAQALRTSTEEADETVYVIRRVFEIDRTTLPIGDYGMECSDGLRHIYPEDLSDLDWASLHVRYEIEP